MKRYKLLTQDGYVATGFKVGQIYNETERMGFGIKVSAMVNRYPSDWQLIEEKQEKQEKRPIMTYIILSVIMALYLYAGLAEINWPLIPATIMGFCLLFKIERNGRSN